VNSIAAVRVEFKKAKYRNNEGNLNKNMKCFLSEITHIKAQHKFPDFFYYLTSAVFIRQLITSSENYMVTYSDGVGIEFNDPHNTHRSFWRHYTQIIT